MCFAMAGLGAIGGIISAVGSLVGAMAAAAGAQQQANAQAQAAQYQAQVARNNATAEAYKGAERSQDVAIQGDYKLAQQRAAYAAAGVDVSTGSPVTVFGISSGRVAGDVAAEQYAGAINAQRWQDQATLKELEAVNARKAGDIAARGAIIGGITGAASGFFKAGSGFGSPTSAFG